MMMAAGSVVHSHHAALLLLLVSGNFTLSSSMASHDVIQTTVERSDSVRCGLDHIMMKPICQPWLRLGLPGLLRLATGAINQSNNFPSLSLDFYTFGALLSFRSFVAFLIAGGCISSPNESLMTQP